MNPKQYTKWDNPQKDKRYWSMVAIRLVIFFCTVNNIMHGAVFYHYSFQRHKPDSYWDFFTSPENFQSFFVMFVVDVALITLVLYGKTKNDLRIASILAFVLFLINVLFADIFQDVYALESTFSDPEKLTRCFGKILFSALFSFIIHHFSRLSVRIANEGREEDRISSQLAAMKQDLSTSIATMEQNVATAKQIQADQNQIQSTLNQNKGNQEQLQNLNKQLDEQKKQTKSWQARYEMEKISRTLFLEGDPQLCESIKAVNGRMAGLTEKQKEYHRERKMQEENKWAQLVN